MEKSNFKTINLNINISNVHKQLSTSSYKKIFLIFIILLTLILWNLNVGSTNINIFQIIINLFNDNSDSAIILLNLRLPHVLCATIAGFVLGICGCILQSALGNPLASPTTIGLSQGAACGACISIIVFESFAINTFMFTVLCAFIFALIPTFVIFVISKINKLDTVGIVLAGIAISIFFGGLVALIEYFADTDKVAEIVFWTFGSVYNTNYYNLSIMGIIGVAICVFAIVNYLTYNAMDCGDITAHTLGINIYKTRIRHLIVAALGAGCVTAFCGTINFIGLISPHIIRKFIGSNYKYLIPASALCGSCILNLSDIISASILPGVVLPIGSITSLIGAPIFVYVLIKRK